MEQLRPQVSEHALEMLLTAASAEDAGYPGYANALRVAGSEILAAGGCAQAQIDQIITNAEILAPQAEELASL